MFLIWGTDDFNLDAAFTQTKPLSGNGIALLPMVSIDQVLVKEFVDGRISHWPQSEQLKSRYKITSISTMLGVGFSVNYSQIIRFLNPAASNEGDIFINAIGFMGPSFQNEDYQAELGEKLQGRLSIYNDGEWNFYGFQIIQEDNSFQYDDFDMTISSQLMEFFLGFRF